jgi:hypothetical protein
VLNLNVGLQNADRLKNRTTLVSHRIIEIFQGRISKSYRESSR